MTVMGRASTIQRVLATVFPHGTQALTAETVTADGASDQDPWSAMPFLPYDVFAFCAYLVQLTGLMGHFEPDPQAGDKFGPDSSLKVVISENARNNCLAVAKKWRSDPEGKAPEYVHALWKVLYESSGVGC